MACFGKIMLSVISMLFSIFATVAIVLKIIGHTDYPWIVVLIPTIICLFISSVMVIIGDLMVAFVKKSADSIKDHREKIASKK